jgi:hypothetical protein
VLVGSVLLAPSASAAPTATVAIRDLTPPVVSVDAGGTVTFVNQIQDKTLSIGVGPLAVKATVHTDVTLEVPSGSHALRPGQSLTETFAKTCATCLISHTYRVDGAPLTQVLDLLPALPLPTPFVVNTLVPLPNLPSVNLPALPQVQVDVPTLPLPSTPSAIPPTTGALPSPTTTTTITTTTTTQAATARSIPGTQYTYDVGGGAAQLSPGGSAAPAFDASQFALPGQGSRSTPGFSGSSGGGGAAGTYDGASVPLFGQLAGLDDASLEEDGAGQVVADPGAGPAATLPVPALAAVVALAAVTAALLRTHQAARAVPPSRGSHRAR